MNQEAETDPLTKPSDRIEAAASIIVKIGLEQLRRDTAEALGGGVTDESWAAMLSGEDGRRVEFPLKTAATLQGIVDELDREAERRAEWEGKVEAQFRAMGVEL